MNLRKVTFTVSGLSTLLMHNVQLANPLNPYAKLLSSLNADKKKKGADKDAIVAKMADAEWMGGLYYDKVLGPYVPASYFRAAMIKAARASKEGKDVERAVIVTGAGRFPIQYDGPRDAEALCIDPRFRDQRMAKVGMAYIPRTRPAFEAWEIRNAELAINADHMSEDAFVAFLVNAGAIEGIGDGRAMGCGRFSVVGRPRFTEFYS
jgi:hypothetical protein